MKSLSSDWGRLEFRWITSKEIHVMRIAKGHNEIVVIVCIFKKESPTSFMDT
jgi:hypothetical protein